MKTKFGAIIVDGRGKIGGHVASKNRGGSYLRTKVTPVNAQTVAQTGVRSLFATLSQAWKALTQAQRNAWNAAVGDYARTDIFGDIRNPSGANLYQKLNNILTQLGESVLTDPPLPSSTDAVTSLVLTGASGTPALSLAFDAVAASVGDWLVDATAPMSPGKSYVKNQFRRITTMDPATSPKVL